MTIILLCGKLHYNLNFGLCVWVNRRHTLGGIIARHSSKKFKTLQCQHHLFGHHPRKTSAKDPLSPPQLHHQTALEAHFRSALSVIVTRLSQSPRVHKLHPATVAGCTGRDIAQVVRKSPWDK
jgi:hypothetical protein